MTRDKLKQRLGDLSNNLITVQIQLRQLADIIGKLSEAAYAFYEEDIEED